MSPILRSGATRARRRLIVTAIAVSLLATSVPGQSNSTEQPPLAEALGDVWRWRRIRPPALDDVVYKVRPGRDGGMIAARVGGYNHYNGWKWHGLPYKRPRDDGKELDAIPTAGGWVVYDVINDGRRYGSKAIAGVAPGRDSSIRSASCGKPRPSPNSLTPTWCSSTRLVRLKARSSSPWS